MSDMMGDMISAKEQHKIRLIEEITAKLSDTISRTLGRADEINRFFFGIPEDSIATDSNKPEHAGWFEEHVRMLQNIESRVQDICNALGKIHEVIDKQ